MPTLARALISLSLLITATSARAQTIEALKRMSLEDLVNIEISTVSRVPEPAMTAPAAVYVITRDDIRRAGATSFPEALRLAPGIQIARIDSARYAIGMRGFADRLARSVLVLIDGRAVYSPLFAGTYWEVQDALLDDVDRIEVIRGPGGTLWGANAVNGIINIVTRSARDTQGLVLTGAAGSDVRGLGSARYGVRLGSTGWVRAYVKTFGRGAEYHTDGDEFDDFRMVQGGFRGDWTRTGGGSVTLAGDIYDARFGERAAVTEYTAPYTVVHHLDAPLSGANVRARLTGSFRRGTDYQVQAYYDHTDRDEIPVAESRHTADVDFQETDRRLAHHTIVWGAAYRVTSGRIEAVGPSDFDPDRRTDHLYSAFVEDEVTLVPRRIRVTLGTKVEHNSYSGFEVQPSGRLSWTPDATSTFVWSVTRAVRTPSRVETDYTTTSLLSPAVPSFVRLEPNPGFVPEELTAYEMGYRVRPFGRLYVTASTFFNQHDNLLSTELLPQFVEATPPPPRLVVPVTFANGLHGSSYGVETTADARVAPWWRVTGSYSYLRVDVTRDPGGRDVSQERAYERSVPRHQVQAQSSFDLPRGVSIDWMFRYVSRLRMGAVPAYATSDVRVGWQPAPQIELSVVGQNLHDARHQE